MAKDKVEGSEFALKLTWKQAWIVITIACGIFGTVFAAGVKVEREVGRLEKAKLECSKQEEITKLKLSLGSDLAAALEKRDFYNGQYLWYKKQLSVCEKKGDYINAEEERIPPD